MVSGSLLAVVAGVLAVGGIAKLAGPEATVPMLRALGLPATAMVARALGTVEVLVGGAALLFGGRALAGTVAVAFGAFTVAVPEGPAILRLESAGTPALPLSWAIGPVEVELAADVVASAAERNSGPDTVPSKDVFAKIGQQAVELDWLTKKSKQLGL